MFIGVVGKANVGKSTFFKAATLADVLIANYPFATIKPNSGIGFVRVECIDKDFNTQCNPREGACINHIRFVPIQLVDVAGLVPGAHEGKGLGNQFLNDLSQADALIHVIDAAGSTNEKGEPVEPLSYDPASDIKFLEIELDEWYYGILMKSWERFAKTVRMERKEPYKEIAKQFSGLRVTEELTKQVIEKLKLNKEDASSWTKAELKQFASELRKATKPMVIAANKADISGAMENIEGLKKQFPDYIIIPTSSELELLLKEASKKGLITYIPGANDFTVTEMGTQKMSDAQKKALEYVKNFLDKAPAGTGVQKTLESAVFGLLKYIAVFPVGDKLGDSSGNILPDCFLVPPKTTALEFAFIVHTDFGKNFIKAINVRTKMPIGKEQLLKHRDCVEIHSGK